MSEQVIYPFSDPESKYTMMDNFLFDHIMPLVKPNAWKILCLIIRKTRGWHKAADQISFSQIKAGTGISSDETVSNALKQLVGSQYILAKKGGQWDATEYAINESFSTTIIEAEKGPTTEIEAGPTTEIEAGPTTEIEAGPTTEIEDTKETPLKKVNKKDSSADADFSHPISFLSENEVRALELTISDWTKYLADEQLEKQRKGIIIFIEGKIRHWALMPRSDAELKFFEILENEYDADGKVAPKKFPSLETKRLFNEAAEFHNGTLESVIKTAIHKRGKGIQKITDYINSPEWRKGPTKNGSTDKGQPGIGGQKKRNQGRGGGVPGSTRQKRIDSYLDRNKQNMADYEEKMFG